MSTLVPQLDAQLARRALAHLGCAAARPTLRVLNRLVRAYVRRVPWESASRIARRRDTPATDDCPRWPAEFWGAALALGGGGTCFESNYAFLALLHTLGYTAALTINDMGATRACHTALVVALGGARYLLDVGIPIHAALRLDPHLPTRCAAPFHTYIARPDGERRYQIERTRHPLRNIYTLRDTPVADAAYRAALTEDYGACGLFLDKVVIVKVIDDAIWRFNSLQQPYRLEVFGRRTQHELAIDERNAARTLAVRFGMDAQTIADALAVVDSRT